MIYFSNQITYIKNKLRNPPNVLITKILHRVRSNYNSTEIILNDIFGKFHKDGVDPIQ